MIRKRKVESGERSRFGYAYVRNIASEAFALAKAQGDGCYLHGYSTIVFYAFTFEGYLNHIGQHWFPDWNQLERTKYKSWSEKLAFVKDHFKADFKLGERPFQSVTEAFEFRDNLAHPKSVFDEKITDMPVGTSRRDPEWLQKLQSIEKIQRIVSDVEKALRLLQKCAGLADDPLGMFGHSSVCIETKELPAKRG